MALFYTSRPTLAKNAEIVYASLHYQFHTHHLSKRMPITDSAKKAFRQNVRRRARNAVAKKSLNETVKKYRKLAGTDKTAAAQFLSDLYQKLDKAAKNNLIRPNKAARLKSRLSKKLRSAKTT